MVRKWMLPYGEHAVSWETIWGDKYTGQEIDPHDDHTAREMNLIRGLVMVQASETEAVLGRILLLLDAEAKLERPAGALLREIEKQLDGNVKDQWGSQLEDIRKAIDRRNRIVHDQVRIGSVWRDYATGGGEWVPVISFLGGELYDEHGLLGDLSLQQTATIGAVELLHFLEEQVSQVDQRIDLDA